MARAPQSGESISPRKVEKRTKVEETQLKRFQCIKEFLLTLHPKRTIQVGSFVVTLDPELEDRPLIVIGQNADGTYKVSHKSKPDFPIKNLSEDVLFDMEDYVDANRNAWRQFPQMPGESYAGPPVDEADVPAGRE